MKTTHCTVATIPFVLAVGAAPPALCQTSSAVGHEHYPVKPVRIITGGPGSMPDIISRRLGLYLAQAWGQSVVIENRGGAGLTIGTGAAARAAPDGYTLLVSDRTALVSFPVAYKVSPYNVSRDFAPITLISRSPALLVVHPSVPVKTLRELIELARKNPGKLNYSGAGPVTGNHIAGELFKQLADVDLTLVQYKGGAAAALAAVSGEVAVTISSVPVSMPLVNAGKVRALAITSGKRFSGLPDMPTVAEAGVPGYESEMWSGMLAPAGLPAQIVAKVHRDTVTTLRNPEMRKTFFDQASELMEGTPEEFAKFLVAETARMKKVIDTAGIRLEQ